MYSQGRESVSSVDCDLIFRVWVCVCVLLFVLLLDMADGFGFLEPWLNADCRCSLNAVRSGKRDVYTFRIAFIVPPPIHSDYREICWYKRLQRLRSFDRKSNFYYSFSIAFLLLFLWLYCRLSSSSSFYFYFYFIKLQFIFIIIFLFISFSRHQ